MYVSLLEYDDIQGLLTIKQIAKHPGFYARRFLSVGNKLVLRVINVIPKRKLILLSKLRVSPAAEENHKKKYKKLKMIDGILKLLSIKTNKSLLLIYKNIVWPLYKRSNNPFILFDLILKDERKLNGIKITEDMLEELNKIIKFRMGQKPLKIKSFFKLTCFNFYGIDAIKESLLNGEKKGTQNIPCKI